MATNIYAITDSHQEARNLSGLLSGVYSFEKNNNKPFILLDCGDLFKGIYDKNLCIDTYIEFKNKLPNANIFITLGNNDFGFNQDNFEYLKQTIKSFESNGIHFVCANLKESGTKSYSNLVQRYKILEINDEKILITGFCLNTSVMKNFGLEFEDAKISILNLLESIDEKYDRIFVLNHHWYPYSKELYEFCKTKGIKIDLIIGGHEHSRIEPDYERNIYYPLSFARSLYKMNLNNIEQIKEYSVSDFEVIPEFEEKIHKYEKETHLFEPIAKRVLNLVKWYSEPCALGTFISDNMKRVGQTDIAFHSTGFTMYSLKTGESNIITKYDFEKVICASTPIVKIKINTQQLKEVFENATLKRMYKNNGNSRFLQCSGNIRITGKGNPDDKTYKIMQIEINGEKLLDQNQNPINKTREFSCTIDEFISKGEQGYSVLKDIKSEKILKNGKAVQMNQLLLDSLKLAQDKYLPNSEYPHFELIDL